MLLWYLSYAPINSPIGFRVWDFSIFIIIKVISEKCLCITLKMDESGIDMGFDLATFLTKDFSVDQKVLEEMTAAQHHQDFMFYELKSKAVPITERLVATFYKHEVCRWCATTNVSIRIFLAHHEEQFHRSSNARDPESWTWQSPQFYLLFIFGLHNFANIPWSDVMCAKRN